MKKHLKNGLYLVVFAVAGILFQISCSNSDNENLSPNAQNKVICTQKVGPVTTIWIYDYDGSNPTQVSVTLPPDIVFNFVNGNANAKLSPDGTKVFFLVVDTNNGANAIYSCDVDGSNVVEVVPSTTNADMSFNLN